MNEIIIFGIYLQIVLCQNNIRKQSHMTRVVTHELIHAFDHCRANVDWFNELRHVACSEVSSASAAFMCAVNAGGCVIQLYLFADTSACFNQLRFLIFHKQIAQNICTNKFLKRCSFYRSSNRRK